MSFYACCISSISLELFCLYLDLYVVVIWNFFYFLNDQLSFTHLWDLTIGLSLPVILVLFFFFFISVNHLSPLFSRRLSLKTGVSTCGVYSPTPIFFLSKHQSYLFQFLIDYISYKLNWKLHVDKVKDCFTHYVSSKL